MYIANEIAEPKTKADTRYSFLFQDKKFNPCLRLFFWIRWGEWVFDIRDIREYQGKEPICDNDFKEDYCSSFRTHVAEVILFIGNRKIESVFNEIRKELFLDECMEIVNSIGKDVQDDLPF